LVKAIKYLCKYINNGSDRNIFSVNRENDEITNYLNGRYICTSEAIWRIFNFEIHNRDPTVQHLAVHLENGQRVFFNANNLHRVIENPIKLTLTAFFELCSHDDFAKTLFYHEVSSYYTWDDSRGWLKRRRGKDVPGWPGIKMDTCRGPECHGTTHGRIVIIICKKKTKHSGKRWYWLVSLILFYRTVLGSNNNNDNNDENISL
jgi:hypothetical protein